MPPKTDSCPKNIQRIISINIFSTVFIYIFIFALFFLSYSFAYLPYTLTVTVFVSIPTEDKALHSYCPESDRIADSISKRPLEGILTLPSSDCEIEIPPRLQEIDGNGMPVAWQVRWKGRPLLTGNSGCLNWEILGGAV